MYQHKRGATAFLFGTICGLITGLVVVVLQSMEIIPTEIVQCDDKLGKESLQQDVLNKTEPIFGTAEIAQELKQKKEQFKLVEKEFSYAFNGANGTVAAEIARKVRVFCWIYTHESFHESRARHVRATWAQHCNKFMFFSSKDDPSLPAINAGGIDQQGKAGDNPKDRNTFWTKTKWIAKHIVEHYRDDFDWVLRIDDDAYAVIENLRLLLLAHSPDELIYFGHILHAVNEQLQGKNLTFPQGGGGYVLSRAALKLFVERNGDGTKCFAGDAHDEDQFLGACLAGLGVKIGDSRDVKGGHRFFGDFIGKSLPPISLWDDTNWMMEELSYYPMKQGPECCSDFVVAFHYVNVHTLYLFEYLFYHAQAYGIREPVAEGARALQRAVEEAKNFARKLAGPEDKTARENGGGK